MAVGSEASEGGVNSTLTQLSIAMRDLATDVLDQHQFLNKLGTNGLQGLGFTPTESGTVLQFIDYMATVMQVYQGEATQATPFNFEDALSILWAGG